LKRISKIGTEIVYLFSVGVQTSAAPLLFTQKTFVGLKLDGVKIYSHKLIHIKSGNG